MKDGGRLTTGRRLAYILIFSPLLFALSFINPDELSLTLEIQNPLFPLSFKQEDDQEKQDGAANDGEAVLEGGFGGSSHDT